VTNRSSVSVLRTSKERIKQWITGHAGIAIATGYANPALKNAIKVFSMQNLVIG